MCLPFFHKWDWYGYRHYRDVSFSSVGVIDTEVVGECRRCGKPRVKTVRGQWTPKGGDN